MSVDKLLREAVARGELTHVSLTAHHDKRGLTWRATYRDATTAGQYHGESADPIDAIAAAFLQRKAPRKPRKESADDFDFG